VPKKKVRKIIDNKPVSKLVRVDETRKEGRFEGDGMGGRNERKERKERKDP